MILACDLVKIKCNLSRKSIKVYKFNIIIKRKNLLIFNTNFTISYNNNNVVCEEIVLRNSNHTNHKIVGGVKCYLIN